MKKQGTEKADAGTTAEDKSALEVKPKVAARKKKVTEPADTEPEVASVELKVEEAEPAETKPAKKSAKKAAKKAAAVTKGAPEKIAPEEAEAEEPVEAVAKAPKVSKAKKEKGRDLVVQEPGAQEVAEVLHQPIEDLDKDDLDKDDEAVEVKGPEPKLERLQKILAKAGISSRRKAEELILGGQVQINGKVVMELGTKADPARDHVRVDGKLLQGPERIRYFVLNKPKGFVTTVSDPEGRPTVMQFFASERERLYPVGRLDYLSEGLLLVTNDGELANKLTKASSGVEKTYLVKVAGQPTEDMLDALREGVVIERGRPGTNSGRVRTAPAKIRQVRQGDNPWYEVIIIEGRNRELRKMFEEIGHHVEKIRRVGYGPLVLDLEPGKLRELEPEEVQSLRLASEGKLKTRRRRGPQQAQLPTVAGKTVRYKKADGKPGYEPRTRLVPRPEFQTESKSEFKPEFRALDKAAFKPPFQPSAKPGFKPEFKPGFKTGARPEGRAEFKSENRTGSRPAFRSDARSEFKPTGRAPFKSAGKPEFGGRGNAAGRTRRAEPPVTEYVLPPRKAGPPEPEFDAPRGKGEFNPDYKPGFRTGSKPAFRTEGGAEGRPGFKPGFRKDGPPKRFGAGGSTDRGPQRTPEQGQDRSEAKAFRPTGPRADFKRPPADDDDFVPTKTPGFRIEPVIDRPREERPRGGGFDRAGDGKKSFRPRPEGQRTEGAGGGGRPFRPAGGRPGERPYRPQADRPASGDRPFRPRTDGPPRSGSKPFQARSGSSDRPRPAFGSRPSGDRPNTGRPSSGGEFRPRPSGSGPARFAPRTDGPPRRPKSFDGGSDGPREFRPREAKSFGGPKKFAGAKSFGAKRFDSPKPAPGGRNSVPSNKLGPDGQPRVKVRARDSFIGKNKGRPKPKGKKEE